MGKREKNNEKEPRNTVSRKLVKVMWHSPDTDCAWKSAAALEWSDPEKNSLSVRLRKGQVVIDWRHLLYPYGLLSFQNKQANKQKTEIREEHFKNRGEKGVCMPIRNPDGCKLNNKDFFVDKEIEQIHSTSKSQTLPVSPPTPLLFLRNLTSPNTNTRHIHGNIKAHDAHKTGKKKHVPQSCTPLV